MNRKIVLAILFCVCATVSAVAQTAAPEGMAQVPAGKFWMGREFELFIDSGDFIARDKMDDKPANHVYVDTFYIDKYEVTNTDYREVRSGNRSQGAMALASR